MAEVTAADRAAAFKVAWDLCDKHHAMAVQTFEPVPDCKVCRRVANRVMTALATVRVEQANAAENWKREAIRVTDLAEKLLKAALRSAVEHAETNHSPTIEELDSWREILNDQ